MTYCRNHFGPMPRWDYMPDYFVDYITAWNEAIRINDVIDTPYEWSGSRDGVDVSEYQFLLNGQSFEQGVPISDAAKAAHSIRFETKDTLADSHQTWHEIPNEPYDWPVFVPLSAPGDPPAQARTFATGATRDVEDHKFDYESFLSPLVIREFARYMHAHRVQSDGKLRDGDNWQKGFPLESLMKSMFRHFMDVWTIHRDHIARGSGHEVEDFDGNPVTLEDALCGVLFNVQAYLHELLK